MNEIELLMEEVVELFPLARTKLDAPVEPDGNWFLDINVGDQKLAVLWRPKRSGQEFGVYGHIEEADYGVGPDHLAATKEEALEQLMALISVPA